MFDESEDRQKRPLLSKYPESSGLQSHLEFKPSSNRYGYSDQLFHSTISPYFRYLAFLPLRLLQDKEAAILIPYQRGGIVALARECYQVICPKNSYIPKCISGHIQQTVHAVPLHEHSNLRSLLAICQCPSAIYLAFMLVAAGVTTGVWL